MNNSILNIKKAEEDTKEKSEVGDENWAEDKDEEKEMERKVCCENTLETDEITDFLFWVKDGKAPSIFAMSP